MTEPTTPLLPLTDRSQQRHTIRSSQKLKHQQEQKQRKGKPISSSRNDTVRHSKKAAASRNQVLLGLTIAGLASSVLATVFGLFHVETFLTVYELPLPTYSSGNVLISVLNTVSGLLGAWIVDHAAATTTIQRSDMVGLAGVGVSLGFLAPFLRWLSTNNSSEQSAKWLNAFHFVISMALYDAFNSFSSILMGSIVSDDHTMSDKQRVQFMASGKSTNLIGSFLVARMGLAVFDPQHIHPFRLFCLCLALVAAVMSLFGQRMIHGRSGSAAATVMQFWSNMPFAKRRSSSKRKKQESDSGKDSNEADLDSTTSLYNKSYRKQERSVTLNKLQFSKVAHDFWKHKNFGAWIIMEMLLEALCSFSTYFLKTFVDQLVYNPPEDENNDSGQYYSRETCDWFLSLVRPFIQIAAIGAFLPIRQFGYPRLYSIVFIFNFVLALFMVLFAGPGSPSLILAYLTVFPAITGAMQASGYHLAMADMVLEMKRMHALEGRMAEPSLAALFMGVNALFCKPMESALPVIAAQVLERTQSSEGLFYLLVLPPLICSVIQLMAWSYYSLTPSKTAVMRQELQALKHESSDTKILELR